MLRDISAYNYFEFRKLFAVYFGNNSVFQKTLAQKLGTIKSFLRAGKSPEDIGTYIDSIHISELVNMRGVSVLARMYAIIEPDDVFDYAKAVEVCKRTENALSDEIEKKFPKFANTDIPTYVTVKNKSLKIAQAVQDDDVDAVEDALDELRYYLFKKLTILDINPNNEDNFIDSYEKRVAKLSALLGYKERDLKECSIYDFLIQEEIKHVESKQK
jgi:hypothetical protein